MRPIDADELLEAIGKQDDWIGQMSLEHMAGFNIYSLVQTMPTLKIESEWIPCSERQPEEPGWYLVTEWFSEKQAYESNIAEFKIFPHAGVRFQKGGNKYIYIQLNGFGSYRNFDLCEDCMRSLIKWIKEADK